MTAGAGESVLIVLVAFTIQHAWLLFFSEAQFKNFLINVKHQGSTKVKFLPQAEAVTGTFGSGL